MARPLALQVKLCLYEDVANNCVVKRVPESSEASVAKMGTKKEKSLKNGFM